ncbi:hypothetical protein VTL71DRAFT_8777 [Oculimacula yallundae]|uniref:Uncharacterized protein n=1 Tax=Oculimacula yallundae TaxID=86028 RepID=A0ABR4CYN2_9HELO
MCQQVKYIHSCTHKIKTPLQLCGLSVLPAIFHKVEKPNVHVLNPCPTCAMSLGQAYQGPIVITTTTMQPVSVQMNTQTPQRIIYQPPPPPPQTRIYTYQSQPPPPPPPPATQYVPGAWPTRAPLPVPSDTPQETRMEWSFGAWRPVIHYHFPSSAPQPPTARPTNIPPEQGWNQVHGLDPGPPPPGPQPTGNGGDDSADDGVGDGRGSGGNVTRRPVGAEHWAWSNTLTITPSVAPPGNEGDGMLGDDVRNGDDSVGLGVTPMASGNTEVNGLDDGDNGGGGGGGGELVLPAPGSTPDLPVLPGRASPTPSIVAHTGASSPPSSPILPAASDRSPSADQVYPSPSLLTHTGASSHSSSPTLSAAPYFLTSFAQASPTPALIANTGATPSSSPFLSAAQALSLTSTSSPESEPPTPTISSAFLETPPSPNTEARNARAESLSRMGSSDLHRLTAANTAANTFGNVHANRNAYVSSVEDENQGWGRSMSM